MKKTAMVLLIIIGLLAIPLAGSAAKNGKPAKIEICHIPDAGEPHVVVVSENALDAHLAHGDIPGDCDPVEEPPPPAAPNAEFVVESQCYAGWVVSCTVRGTATGSNPEGTTYAWTFEGAGVPIYFTGPTFQQGSLSPGTYWLTLTATFEGLSSMTTTEVVATLP